MSNVIFNLVILSFHFLMYFGVFQFIALIRKKKTKLLLLQVRLFKLTKLPIFVFGFVFAMILSEFGTSSLF